MSDFVDIVVKRLHNLFFVEKYLEMSCSNLKLTFSKMFKYALIWLNLKHTLGIALFIIRAHPKSIVSSNTDFLKRKKIWCF